MDEQRPIWRTAWYWKRAKAFSLKVYPELEMFAPFSPEENGIRGYPQGYGIRENAPASIFLLLYSPYWESFSS